MDICGLRERKIARETIAPWMNKSGRQGARQRERIIKGRNGNLVHRYNVRGTQKRNGIVMDVLS